MNAFILYFRHNFPNSGHHLLFNKIRRRIEEWVEFSTVLNQRFMTALVFLVLCPFLLVASAPALLDPLDEETVYAVLANEIPDLTIRSLILISSGETNLVADVNDEWIFRFPRAAKYSSILQREKILLENLRNFITLEIPHYQYFGMETAFVGYPKIAGVKLNDEKYLKLSMGVRQQIAESLALFLTQLHNSVNVNEASQWGYEKYDLPLKQIQRELLGTFSSPKIEQMVKKALKHAKQLNSKKKNYVLLHGDLHAGNLVFDVNSQKIVGVIDFSSVSVGECSVDFGKLFTIHPDLALRTAEVYTRLNTIKNPLLDGAVNYILRRCVFILRARKSDDTSRETRLIEMLESFIPIWNDLQNREL